MKLVIISNPENFEGEIKIVENLFENGMQYFHLRKPDFTKQQIKDYLDSLSSKYYNKIVLHSHHDLVIDYGLKGGHFSLDRKEILEKYEESCFHKSLSLHSIKELKEIRYKSYDYVFLSPVYDSISKKDYLASSCKEDFKEYSKHNTLPFSVIALGGIDDQKISELKEFGFDGVAILGYLWQEIISSEKGSEIEKKFLNLLSKCI